MQEHTPQILLVEEDATLCDITAFRLELLGYGVHTANTADEARQQIQQTTPDLILLDLVLPDMDGVDLVNLWKNDATTNVIPILILSADADLNSVERAFAAGANDYLVTPYDPAVLEEKLEGLLEAVLSTS
jgi:DNA-binding response OmpR family regulator